VMEDPGPAGEDEHRGWTVPYWNDDIAKWQTDQLFTSDALLLGRVTYDEFVASWPLRSGDPFSDRMNSLPKFVASTTLQEPLEWEQVSAGLILQLGDGIHNVALEEGSAPSEPRPRARA
jgi:dihydrofolate reductase